MVLGFLKQFRTALMLLIILALITGILYPALVTGCAQFLFPWRANGSILERDGKKIGSELIGQTFTDAKYFWGRPSATTPYPYNAEASSGSNAGPLNKDFLAIVKSRKEFLENADLENKSTVPIDLITASGSGLDPDISPMAAAYQLDRIAKARRIPVEKLQKLVNDAVIKRCLGLFGEQRVNVLKLNLALDELEKNMRHGAA